MVDVYSCPISDGVNTLIYSIIFDVTDRETYREELLRKNCCLPLLDPLETGLLHRWIWTNHQLKYSCSADNRMER